MKKVLVLLCTILCANVLLAQTEFMVGELLYKVTNSNEVIVKDCVPVATSIIIPTTVSNSGTTYTVTSIGERAFELCSSLTSVTIPNSVTSIGNSAFYKCNSLTSITIPNSITSIGQYAFSSCGKLTSVTIGNNVTSIGERAFEYCRINTLNFNAINCSDFFYSSDNFDYPPFYMYCSVNTINIGDSVQRIPKYFAYKLDSLTSIIIPESVTSIGGSAFAYCDLTSVTIGNNVTAIGNYAFYNCDSLTSITIPNSVTSIGQSAFEDCSSLTSVTIGNRVTSIGWYTFRGCSLDTVTCLAITPPSSNAVFSGTYYSTTLNVYCGLKNYYSMAWGDHFSYNNIYEIPFAIDVNVNNEVGGNVTIENNCSTATLTATANDCYQFVSWNDGNTDNPRIISFTSDTSLTAIFENLNTELSATICEGSVYNENGFNVSEAGVYTQTLQTVNGCDSIVTLTVTEYPTFDTTINATINAGETYAEFGFNESEAGTYVQNLQTEFDCDSTITLVLSVNSSLLDIEQTEITFYPNPTDSKITFSQAIEKVEVIDLTGKAILTFTNAKTINIESLPAGAYYLRLTNEEKTSLQKVIKQ